ncbi:MAG: hypothetical protein AAFU71_13475, partial [Cyanobacteria bacterium J06632_22]
IFLDAKWRALQGQLLALKVFILEPFDCVEGFTHPSTAIAAWTWDRSPVMISGYLHGEATLNGSSHVT